VVNTKSPVGTVRRVIFMSFHLLYPSARLCCPSTGGTIKSCTCSLKITAYYDRIISLGADSMTQPVSNRCEQTLPAVGREPRCELHGGFFNAFGHSKPLSLRKHVARLYWCRQ